MPSWPGTLIDIGRRHLVSGNPCHLIGCGYVLSHPIKLVDSGFQEGGGQFCLTFRMYVYKHDFIDDEDIIVAVDADAFVIGDRVVKELRKPYQVWILE